ncbi:MAG: alpha/beta hydrolase [Clostridium sp.]|nr:alpha/beta hydrolase [Clostridium sp.]
MMRIRLFARCFAAAIALLFAAGPLWAVDFAGRWEGQLMGLSVVFDIEKDGAQYRATMDSPMQGAADIPTSIRVDGDSIFLRVDMAGAVYCGCWSAADSRINGRFAQNGIDVPMMLLRAKSEDKNAASASIPLGDYSFGANSRIVFTNDTLRFGATLTLPLGQGPFPAVVFVSGSGPQNRDGEIYGHRPFQLMADFLASHGIVSLRYDDRGVGDSSAGPDVATTADLATDALAALRYLRTLSMVDTLRTGYIGHSEGGMIAAMNAADHPSEVSFVISMAGPVMSGRQTMILQNEAIARLSGNPLDSVRRATIVQIFDAIADTTLTPEALRERLTALMTADGHYSPGAIARQTAVMTSPWYVSFVRTDPAESFARIEVPVLLLGGEWDCQVDTRANTELARRIRPETEIRVFPRVNHMFQPAQAEVSSMNYAQIKTTIDPSVLSAVIEFIKKQ